MKDLKYNLDSVEVSYGDNTLTSITTIATRIDDIAENLRTHDAEFNDFEREEISRRLDKLIELNQKIQQECKEQADTLASIKPLRDRRINVGQDSLTV